MMYSTRAQLENNGNALFLWKQDSALMGTFLPNIACSSTFLYEVLRVSPRIKTIALTFNKLCKIVEKTKSSYCIWQRLFFFFLPTASQKHRMEPECSFFDYSYSCTFKNRICLVHENSFQMLLTENELFSQYFKCDL